MVNLLNIMYYNSVYVRYMMWCFAKYFMFCPINDVLLHNGLLCRYSYGVAEKHFLIDPKCCTFPCNAYTDVSEVKIESLIRFYPCGRYLGFQICSYILLLFFISDIIIYRLRDVNRLEPLAVRRTPEA